MTTILPISRYRFTARLRKHLQLPEYAGSLLRGQFGAALRQLACMTRQPTCPGCPLKSTCPYTRIFEAVPPPQHCLQKFSAVPNAYVIEPPPLASPPIPAGEELVFHMVLVGDAIQQLALVAYAWQRALLHGLTRERIVSDLERIDWVDKDGIAHAIWTREQPLLADHPASLHWPEAPAGLRALQLNISTPLRLQSQGHPLRPNDLVPRDLLATVARRVALVLEFHAGQTDWGEGVPDLLVSSAAVEQDKRLRWYDWTRYSSRQRQEMTLGGVIGHWQLQANSGVLESFWPWLWLGQWLHVGKNATMGMGAYTLETIV
ncbi:MAG: CRISPR system precrRNA processing endoribonuclease RAMP protein Cas6 [Rhodoferax sp.]|nr:CRISPR system precrRNA processing endoribonuclease RAMP protein Cas6 [Rhodoferax sp.]